MSTPVTSQLSARGLTRHFQMRSGGLVSSRHTVHAVDDVSIDLVAGRVSAVVGESGSGKSVLARMLARIVVPTSGEIELEGTRIDVRAKRTLAYASQVQLVLQDPFASMNPVHKIAHNLERPLLLHGARQEEVTQLAHDALRRVSLDPPERFMDRYPHELSGGQLQRVSIARALCVRPTGLLADEPISMLVVSVRLGVLNLLRELCERERLAILYITHDIASARYIADVTVVMYAGQIVEQSSATELTDAPTHPYTKLLVASVPDPTDPTSLAPRKADRSAQAPLNIVGCRFAPRCTSVMDICRSEEPPMFEVSVGHTSRCWLYRDATPVALRTSSDAQSRGGNDNYMT